VTDILDSCEGLYSFTRGGGGELKENSITGETFVPNPDPSRILPTFWPHAGAVTVIISARDGGGAIDIFNDAARSDHRSNRRRPKSAAVGVSESQLNQRGPSVIIHLHHDDCGH
jgi:hypothetical protein